VELDQFRQTLHRLQQEPLAVPFVETLADEWLNEARSTVGVDTGQLKARINLVSLRGSAMNAEARIHADTPYAGFHNYGTRYTAPNRFWNKGQDAAVSLADRLGGRLRTGIERALSSGGVWNPRRLFGP